MARKPGRQVQQLETVTEKGCVGGSMWKRDSFWFGGVGRTCRMWGVVVLRKASDRRGRRGDASQVRAETMHTESNWNVSAPGMGRPMRPELR